MRVLSLAAVCVVAVTAAKDPQYLYPIEDFTDEQLGLVTYIDFWSCGGEISFTLKENGCEY
jgi:hypothetical protein